MRGSWRGKAAVSSLAGRKVKSLKWKKSFVASFSSLLDLKAHRWTVWFSLTALINLVSSSSRQLFYSLWLGAEDSRSLSPIIDSWNQTEVTCQVFPFEHTAQISSFCELCERLIDACRLSLSVSPEKDWTRFKEPNVKLSSVLSVWLLLKCDNSQEKELEIHYSDLLTKCYYSGSCYCALKQSTRPHHFSKHPAEQIDNLIHIHTVVSSLR